MNGKVWTYWECVSLHVGHVLWKGEINIIAVRNAAIKH